MRSPLLLLPAADAAVAVIADATGAAELKLPRPSQKAQVMQTVGLTDVTINYSRPGVKGRTIWGDLVPYDKVWRTGANEATTITLLHRREGEPVSRSRPGPTASTRFPRRATGP